MRDMAMSITTRHFTRSETPSYQYTTESHADHHRTFTTPTSYRTLRNSTEYDIIAIKARRPRLCTRQYGISMRVAGPYRERQRVGPGHLDPDSVVGQTIAGPGQLGALPKPVKPRCHPERLGDSPSMQDTAARDLTLTCTEA